MSDIKFVGEDIHIEGNVQKVTCFDIELDNAGRRSSNGGKRRAFVHDFQDGLTLNWANDYPGGITLNGKVAVGELAGTHLFMRHHDLHLDHAARRSAATGYRRALVHDFQDGLTINWARDYPGGVTINGELKIPNSAAVSKLDGLELKCSHHTLHLDHAAHRPPPLVVTREAAASKAAAKSGKAARASVAAKAPGNVLVGPGILVDPNIQIVPRLSKRRALMHDNTDGLTINVAGDYPGGVTIHGVVRLPGSLAVKGQDLLQLLTELQAKVAALEARVTALEAPEA